MSEVQSFVDFMSKLGPFGLVTVVCVLLYLGKLRLEREVKAAEENAERAWEERDKALQQLSENNEATAKLVAAFGELRAVIDALVRERTRQ